MTDAERIDGLLPELRRQEPGAFTDLYDLMAGPMLSFAHGHLGDRHAAEDVVQETFLRLARQLHRFRGDGRALLAWLYTTVRRACIDQHRRRARRGETLVGSPPAAAIAADQDAVVASSDPRLDAAMASLTEQQRTAVVLRRVVGLSGDEVADAMGLGRDAVYALCARAEAALRVLLASDGDAVARQEA